MAVIEAGRAETVGKPVLSLLNNARVRGFLYQALTLAAVVGGIWYLVSNTITNMSQRGMAAGFDFLGASAGFTVSFTLIPYQPSDSYWRVFQVGMANTLLVAVIASLLATAIGLVVGLARLSDNWVIRNIARWYIEILRNTPLLLQIIAWYFGVFTLLPNPRASVNWGDLFYLNNRGLYFPAPIAESGFGVFVIVVCALIVGIVAFWLWTRDLRRRTGKIVPVVLLARGAPRFSGRRLRRAGQSPLVRPAGAAGPQLPRRGQCAAHLLLADHRAGGLCLLLHRRTDPLGHPSVGRGQTEAARALGVPPSRTMASIIIPQAMRVIIPPLISQYLNVTKNSSLAIAIGFPDLVGVWMNTALNQSGRAIPIVALTMAFYCAVSLAVSLAMNAYNRRVLLKER